MNDQLIVSVPSDYKQIPRGSLSCTCHRHNINYLIVYLHRYSQIQYKYAVRVEFKYSIQYQGRQLLMPSKLPIEITLYTIKYRILSVKDFTVAFTVVSVKVCLVVCGTIFGRQTLASLPVTVVKWLEYARRSSCDLFFTYYLSFSF